MIVLRIDVVRTSAEDDPVPAGLLKILNRLLAFFLNVAPCCPKLCPSCSGRAAHFLFRDRGENADQSFRQDLLIRKGEERVHEVYGRILEFLDVILDVFRVGSDDRAVIVVDCPLKFLAFVGHTGIENVPHALIEQPLYVTVRKLGRVALGFARDRLDSQFIDLSGGSRREDDLEPELRKESEPERIILEHIEDARDPDASSRSIFQRFIAEDPLILVIIDIREIVLIFLQSQTLLTAVAGDKTAAA